MAMHAPRQQVETQFIRLMAELFQLDEAEALDFGIYRVIRAHNRQVQQFLGEIETEGETRRLAGGKLVPCIEAILRQADGEDRSLADLRRHLGIGINDCEAVIAQRLTMLESIPAMQASVAQYRQACSAAQDANDEARLEVFNRLYEFFSRHYADGDFIVSRSLSSDGARYLRSSGADIEYRWATEDLVYIKSGDLFTDYAVRLPNGRRLAFAVDAETLANTRAELKPSDSARYKLNRIESSEGGCRAVFDYIKGAARGKAEFDDAVARIATETQSDNGRIALELRRYITRNRADYFLHTRLKEALREDLDLFIKTHVLAVDSLLAGETGGVGALRIARAVRKAGREIIDFLGVLEDFQLALWQKKKLVLGQTRYVITLDRVAKLGSAELAEWAETTARNRPGQMEEWLALKLLPDRDAPLVVDGRYLPLPLDTRHFPPEFTARLLAGLTENADNRLDDLIDGIALHADNRHALELIRDKFAGRIKCIYIDPPYNTGGDGFPYKDSYRHASWLSMISERLHLAKPLLARNGAIFVSIDSNERSALCAAMDKVFGAGNRVEEIIWAQNTTKNQSPTYSNNHEFVEVYARDLEVAKADKRMFREPKPGAGDLLDLVESLNLHFPSIEEIEQEISMLFQRHQAELRSELEEQGIEYDRSLDPWKGLYNYCHAEYRDAEGRYVEALEARQAAAKIWVWREDNPSMPAGKQADSTRDPARPNYRYYTPENAANGKKYPCPKRGWCWPLHDDPEQVGRASFTAMDSDRRIVWGNPSARKLKVPQVKKFLHEVDSQVSKSVVLDYTDGEKELTKLVGRTNSFPNPKPTTLIGRFIAQTTDDGDWVLDFFAGSGTTWHAALNAHHDDHQRRKVLLVEGGAHFEAVLIPRLKRTSAARAWKGGTPSALDGAGCFVRVQSLESYDDTLENLETLEGNDLFPRPQAALRYALHTAADQTPKDQAWRRYHGATLRRCTGADAIESPVDGIESLVWLLGMQVHRQWIEPEGVILTGRDARDRTLTVLWRDADADTAAWVMARMADDAAERIITNAPEELSFPGAERLEAIEAVFVEGLASRGGR